MNKIYFITAISILLTSCSIKRVHIIHKAPKSSKRFNILSNEGTICLQRVSKNSLKVTYLPLSSTCKSSSRYSWQMNDINLQANGSSIAIETYSLYKKSNSQMATADCGGAGIKVKTIKTTVKPLEIKWGKNNIATLDKIGSKSCFKRAGIQIIKTKIIN